jgi:hypothetical protein
MVTSAQLIKKYGDPTVNQAVWEARNMTLYNVPLPIEKRNPSMPQRIYCHRDFAPILHVWFTAMAETSLINEINTWDGCFNIRKKRGGSSLSLHSFGMAVDFNASHNPLGLTSQQCREKGLTPFSTMFIELARKYVDCGADWKTRPDGMHFQVKKLV